MGGLLEFKVIAYEINDESSSTQTQVTVAIVDINDNKPEFAMASYNLQISPDSVDGTSLTLTEDSIHIFDLDRDLYGQHITLRLIEKIREENDTHTFHLFEYKQYIYVIKSCKSTFHIFLNARKFLE